MRDSRESSVEPSTEVNLRQGSRREGRKASEANPLVICFVLWFVSTALDCSSERFASVERGQRRASSSMSGRLLPAEAVDGPENAVR